MRYLTFIFGILLFIGCTKGDRRTPTEKAAVGQYRFEKVKIIRNIISVEDITSKYDGLILQLNDQFQAALIDNNASITQTGIYNIEEDTYTNYDDEGNGTTNTSHTIIIQLDANGRGFEERFFYGENADINRKRMSFDEERAEGTYRYKLVKI